MTEPKVRKPRAIKDPLWGLPAIYCEEDDDGTRYLMVYHMCLNAEEARRFASMFNRAADWIEAGEG